MFLTIKGITHLGLKGVGEMVAIELIDKVIYIKNRVWTVYGTTNNGAFCFQGIKPYPSFKYDSSNMTLNISYFELEDIKASLLESSEIEFYMEKMKSADKKKLTKQHAVDFFVHLTGHTENFISENVQDEGNSFTFKPGAISYDLWKSDGAFLLSHNITGTTHMAYFDYLTFAPHGILNEKNREAYKQQIIDDYKDWKGIDE